MVDRIDVDLTQHHRGDVTKEVRLIVLYVGMLLHLSPAAGALVNLRPQNARGKRCSQQPNDYDIFEADCQPRKGGLNVRHSRVHTVSPHPGPAAAVFRLTSQDVVRDAMELRRLGEPKKAICYTEVLSIMLQLSTVRLHEAGPIKSRHH